MKIKHIPSKKSIVLLDSIKLIPVSLEKALIAFNCNINKGILPYSFYSTDTLNYIGLKPDFKFYSKITINQWNDLPAEFNAEKECIKYLQQDIYGLLELMCKFVDFYYKEFSYDVTQRSTLPGIAFDIWGNLFYEPKPNNEIKMLRGQIVKDIRSAYFGGNVNCYKHAINEGFGYDVISQYPSELLKEMPVGNPVFTTNKDLDQIFGWVYGTIIPPAPDQFYVIINKDENNKRNNPKESWKGWIFTEEDCLNKL